MKFRTDISLERPLAEVVKIFENQDYFTQWQSNLISCDAYESDPKQSINIYSINGRMVEVRIRVVENNLPHCVETIAELDGLVQKATHNFTELSQNHTKWVVESEVFSPNLILKLSMLMAPSMYKKRTQNYLQDFKKFVEDERFNHSTSEAAE